MGRWDDAERLSKVVSIAAIPLVLAVGGWIIQTKIQEQAVRRDYVQLAVSILREPDTAKVRPALRDWAVQMLNVSAPVKLSAAAETQLQTGKAILPPPTQPEASPEQIKLLEQLNSPDRAARVGAYEQLTTKFPSAPEIIEASLAQIEEPQLKTLSGNGIVNLLVLLEKTDPKVWTAEQLKRAHAAFTHLESLGSAGDARIGPVIASHLHSVRARLQGVQAH